MSLTWLDRLLLGPGPTRRAEEAERRYQAAEAARTRLGQEVEEGRKELAAAVQHAAETAHKVAELPLAPSIAAAVAELAGDEGIVESHEHDRGREQEPEPPPARR